MIPHTEFTVLDPLEARIVAEASQMRKELRTTAAERDRLRVVNAELVAALKVMTEYVEIDIEGDDNANSGTRADCRKARAAIALAEQS